MSRAVAVAETYVVELVRPAGMTAEQMRSYIVLAIEQWGHISPEGPAWHIADHPVTVTRKLRKDGEL